jgi:hypothetical protein
VCCVLLSSIHHQRGWGGVYIYKRIDSEEMNNIQSIYRKTEKRKNDKEKMTKKDKKKLGEKECDGPDVFFFGQCGLLASSNPTQSLRISILSHLAEWLIEKWVSLM